MSYSDYYSVLGVERSASQTEITKAYRVLAKKFHPDVSKEPGAETRFKEVGEAYEVLKDPEKRALYDKWGPHWKAISEGRAPPRGGPSSREVKFDFGPFGFSSTDSGETDMSSIFEQVFRDQSIRQQRRRRRRRRSSQDAEVRLDLPVGFAFRGGKRPVEFVDRNTGKKRQMTVGVPERVRDGQRIRLAGQGVGGGDLFLVVRLVDDEHFRRSGDDVYTTLRISPDEAALGAETPLRTLDGKVKVKVPAGSSTGRTIRLRGRGYPRGDNARGDLYAEIAVVVPGEVSEEERALYERLREISRFDPRA